MNPGSKKGRRITKNKIYGKMKKEIETQSEKKCPHCESYIPVNAKKCSQCQSDLRRWSYRHQFLSVLIIIGAVIITLIFLGNVFKGSTSIPSTSTPSTFPNKQLSLSFEETKTKAIKNLAYDKLFRNNEKYVGEIVYYRGEVSQAIEGKGDNYVLRIFITKGEYGFWDNDIFANYKGTRVLEDDIVDIWGQVKGVRKYTTVLGATRSIPEIDVLYLNVVK